MSVLADGDVDVLGRMPWSSNATFLVNLTLADDEMLAIYKPQRDREMAVRRAGREVVRGADVGQGEREGTLVLRSGRHLAQ